MGACWVEGVLFGCQEKTCYYYKKLQVKKGKEMAHEKQKRNTEEGRETSETETIHSTYIV